MSLALELLPGKSPVCLNGPKSGSALEEGFGCDANVGEETAVPLPAAATFSRGAPRVGKGVWGGSIFSQMSDSRLSIAHSVQAVAAEVRRGREGAGEWAGERNKGTCGW